MRTKTQHLILECGLAQSNIENLNSVFIAQGMSKTDRLRLLAEIAKKQRLALDGLDVLKGLKKLDKTTYLNIKDTDQ